MKKYILIVLLFIANLTFAQKFQEKREKIQALKVAFITEKLSLTAEEAQQFWPIYNAFEENLQTLHKKKRKSILLQSEEGSLEKLTDKEATALLKEMESVEEDILALHKKLTQDLQKILSAKKIIILKKTEEEFNRKLLKQFREKRG